MVFEPRRRGKACGRVGWGPLGLCPPSPPCIRSRVWAEPCLLPTATSKLSGAVEQWLSAAERLYGPYMWGRYVPGRLGARWATRRAGQRASPAFPRGK